MARFYFNTADGGRDVDKDGVELKDRTEARKEAVRYAGALMKGDPCLVWDGHDFRVEVLGEDGGLICTVVVLVVDTPQTS